MGQVAGTGQRITDRLVAALGVQDAERRIGQPAGVAGVEDGEKTEIGSMAESLQVFKEALIAKKAADEAAARDGHASPL